MPNKTIVNISGISIKLSSLDKILYPQADFSKGQVIDYYIRIAPLLLPHLENRPLTLKRYPNGIEKSFFYQKQCPDSKQKWLSTLPVWSEGNKRYTNFCLANNLPSLIWVANLAALELHTSLSSANNLQSPTMVVFDLDPGAPADIIDCAQVSIWLRDIFEDYGLKSFPKTSGSKGLQIYVPLNTPVDYNQTKSFAKKLAVTLQGKYPDKVIAKMSKQLRTGKVFIDWSQNDEHKTTVCVYSLRATPQPFVSAPVTWNEIEIALQQQNPQLLSFDSAAVLDRVNRHGDLFAPVLTLSQRLL